MSEFGNSATRRPARSDGQQVTGTAVFGDVIQISGVGGDVTISTDRPRYSIEPFPSEVTALAPDLARAQPSRMLQPRYRIVPFGGRDEELAGLTEWLDTPNRIAVRMLHAPGGHGKTRLADFLATEAATHGWSIRRVLHVPGGGAHSELEFSTDGGILVLVDYADRWPYSDLLALITHLRDLARHSRPIVRVLLVARAAGFWWHCLANRLDVDLEVEPTAQFLEPIGAANEPTELFASAHSAFAAAMGLEPEPGSPPRDLLGPDYASILTIHMAALVTVDAQRRGRRPPNRPYALSSYLLRREYSRWFELHNRSEGSIATTPEFMRRTVYISTLSGGLPRRDARTAVRRVELAVTTPDADRLIDDHRICYPPDHALTALEPLHPDRLGEDMIGLSTPGHPYHRDPDAWISDDWAATACDTLLVGTAAPPAWAPSVITILVETAHRWRHIAEQVLYPLIREHPDLVVDAGGGPLTRLAEIPDVPFDVLESVDSRLPPPTSRHIGLDAAAAAISAAMLDDRLRNAATAAERARIHAEHAARLFNSGLRSDAVRPSAEAVALFRELCVIDRSTYLPDLARVLTNHAIWVGELADAASVLIAAEAVDLYRELVGIDRETHVAELARALSIYATHLAGAGSRADAVPLSAEALDLHRERADHDRARYLLALAQSVLNHSVRLVQVGRSAHALPLAAEARGLFAELARSDRAAHLSGLAKALVNYASRLSENRRAAEAVPISVEAVAMLRELAESNRTAHLPDLATGLTNHALHLARIGNENDALLVSEEVVSLHRELAETNRATHLPDLVTSLINHAVRLFRREAHEEAVKVCDEAVTASRELVADQRAATLHLLAAALTTHACLLSEAGSQVEAIDVAAEAVTLHRELLETNRSAHLFNLAAALGNHAEMLTDVGRRDEALPVSTEVVARYLELTVDDHNYLGELRTALAEHTALLEETGHDESEVAAEYERSIEQLSPGAGTVLLIARARWHLLARRDLEAHEDALRANTLAETESDAGLRATAQRIVGQYTDDLTGS